ncbi:MAG: hypothetical protein QG629_576 [Patescibacteria group bacterium]|nr:hypothetical protein [Patescibacteria group bacterium]
MSSAIERPVFHEWGQEPNHLPGHDSISGESMIALPESTCFSTTDPALIQKAQLLTAQEYLRRKFITPSQIGEDGTILPEHDPYREHSKYFVKTTPDGKDVIATLRVIKHDPIKGKGSFPVLDHENDLDPDYVARINSIGAENLLEVSALVRDKNLDKDGSAALQLYKQMMLESWSEDRTGKGTLIMACNPVLFDNFRLLFDGSMQRIGPDLPYPGQEAIPAMLELTKGSLNVIDISRDKSNPYRKLHKTVLEYFFTGADAKNIDPSIINSLREHGYETLVGRMENNNWSGSEAINSQIQNKIKYAGAIGKVQEKAKKYRPEIAANVLLAGYTAVRTVGVAQGVDPYADTNWETFLAIELGTQIPYTMGISDLIRGGAKENYPRARKLLASAAVGSAFAAPYAYIVANGGTESIESAVTGGTILAVGMYFLSGQVKRIRSAYDNQKEKRAIKKLDLPQENSVNTK